MRTNREFYDYVDSLPNEFERVLWRQVGDLPYLPDDPRKIYFGVDSEISGTRWHNDDVDGFLERAVEGAFHGWEAEGEDVEDISWLDWRELASFLGNGQWYE